MSEENVEIARHANAAFNSHDVDETLQFFSPDAELRDLAIAPEQAGVVKGIDANPPFFRFARRLSHKPQASL